MYREVKTIFKIRHSFRKTILTCTFEEQPWYNVGSYLWCTIQMIHNHVTWGAKKNYAFNPHRTWSSVAYTPILKKHTLYPHDGGIFRTDMREVSLQFCLAVTADTWVFTNASTVIQQFLCYWTLLSDKQKCWHCPTATPASQLMLVIWVGLVYFCPIVSLRSFEILLYKCGQIIWRYHLLAIHD